MFQSRLLIKRSYHTSTNLYSHSSKKPVFITTPIFYVNGKPHIGHLHSALIADALSRWHKQTGYKTFFSTGTDEHGLKVRESADKLGIPVKELCDINSKSFKDLFDKANIQYDDYIRTVEDRHKNSVIKFWNELYKRDQIYLGMFEGWYSVSDETYLTSSQVLDSVDSQGNPIKVSAENGNPLILLKEPNYLFKLSNYKDKLIKWIHENDPIYPPQRKNEVLSSLEHGLRDLSVSRLKEKIQWGIQTPNDENHLIYVWLDALTNYLTVCGYPDEEKMKELWPANYHIVGKDIIKFHSIYWPAFLFAAGIEPPLKIIAHAHWTMNKEKMAKSKGNVVDPFELIDQYGVDFVRYFLLRDGGLADDGDFSYEELDNRLTDELSNVFGNLLRRSISKGMNPDLNWPVMYNEVLNDEEKSFIERITNLPDLIDEKYKLCEFGKGLETIIMLLKDINDYYSSIQPWKLVPKKDNDLTGEELQNRIKKRSTIVYIGLESVRVSSLLLRPIMPERIDQLLDFLGIPEDKRDPMKYRFGYQYKEGNSTKSIKEESFIFYDDRKKKEERYLKKQNRRNERNN